MIEGWESERWDSAKLGVRVEWTIRCKWITTQKRLSRTGERIAQSQWKDLSPAARTLVSSEIRKDYPHRRMRS